MCARDKCEGYINGLLTGSHCDRISLTILKCVGIVIAILHSAPFLIVTSSAATKSVKTASTSSNPTNTFIISELGFVYFFERTEERKAARVCAVSFAALTGAVDTYIKSMNISWSASCFDTCHRAQKELSCLRLY